MNYRIAPLLCRHWTLNGIAPKLIESHYEHNYGAALNRLNIVTDECLPQQQGRSVERRSCSAGARSWMSRRLRVAVATLFALLKLKKVPEPLVIVAVGLVGLVLWRAR